MAKTKEKTKEKAGKDKSKSKSKSKGVDKSTIAEAGAKVADPVVLPIRSIKMPPEHLIRRKNNGDISNLVQGIKKQGQIHELTVRPGKNEGQYELLSGHRRFAAIREIGKDEARVHVRRDLADDNAALAFIIAENEGDSRKAFKPMEQATAYQALVDAYVKGGGDERSAAAYVAKQVGASPDTVRRTLRLLEVPEEIAKLLTAERVSKDGALEITKIGDEDTQNHVLKEVVKRAKDQSADDTVSASEIREIALSFANEQADEGKVESDSSKKDGRTQSAPASAWLSKSAISEFYDMMLTDYIQHTQGADRDESRATIRAHQIALVMYFKGQIKDTDIEGSAFTRILKAEIKRVMGEYDIPGVNDESGKDVAEPEDKKSKKGKDGKKAKRQRDEEEPSDDTGESSSDEDSGSEDNSDDE